MLKKLWLPIVLTILLIAAPAGAQQAGLTEAGTFRATDANGLIVGAFTREAVIQAGSATLGATPPVETTVGTSRALCFDADAEEVYFTFEVPSDWDGLGDMNLILEWFPESGAAIADGETVIWESDYRSLAAAEIIDNGSLVTATTTYTQSGAGTDKETIATSLVLDFDSANQPLTAGDHAVFQLNRDFTTDTYASDVCLFQMLIAYEAIGLVDGGA